MEAFHNKIQLKKAFFPSKLNLKSLLSCKKISFVTGSSSIVLQTIYRAISEFKTKNFTKHHSQSCSEFSLQDGMTTKFCNKIFKKGFCFELIQILRDSLFAKRLKNFLSQNWFFCRMANVSDSILKEKMFFWVEFSYDELP